jgi:hypothetical protein
MIHKFRIILFLFMTAHAQSESAVYPSTATGKTLKGIYVAGISIHSSTNHTCTLSG